MSGHRRLYDGAEHVLFRLADGTEVIISDDPHSGVEVRDLNLPNSMKVVPVWQAEDGRIIPMSAIEEIAPDSDELEEYRVMEELER
jgi:hypothetical protein